MECSQDGLQGAFLGCHTLGSSALKSRDAITSEPPTLPGVRHVPGRASWVSRLRRPWSGAGSGPVWAIRVRETVLAGRVF